MAGSLPLAFVYLCFFLSGASSLVYEVVWMRWLVLTLGSTTAAVSTVLFTFMVGLALGAWAFGGIADRSRSPLKLYAFLEAGIGFYALLLPWLVGGLAPAYVAVAQALEGYAFALTLVRFASGAAVLLIPTVLMGATLPVLIRFVGTHGSMGRSLGLLYGTNVAGAVVGCTAAGFFLIRHLGLSGTTAVALVANLVAAGLAFLAAGMATSSERASEEPRPDWEPPASSPRWLMWSIVFLSGFVTMAWEVLWTRILIFSIDSTAQAFTLILAVFLSGLALGSWIFAVLIAGKRETLPVLAAAEITAGILALLLVPWGVRAFDLMLVFLDYAGVSYASQAMGNALAAGALMLLPTVLLGIVFPMASRMLADRVDTVGEKIGRAYFVNTVGSALGALAAPFVFLPWLTLKGSFFALSVLPILAGWALLAASPLPGRRRGLAIGGSAAALGLCTLLFVWLLPGPNPFDPPSRFRIGDWSVLAHEDTANASVSVIEYATGGRSLRIDGFEAAGSDGGSLYGYMQLMSHLPILLHPDPKRVLVISVGTGSTAGAAALHPGTSVDMVDINPAVLKFTPYFATANANVAENPRAHGILDDGRNHLLVSDEKYDVITSEPMPPTFAGIVNLYSREYYEQAKEQLNEGGYLVQWLPFHLLEWHQAMSILATVQDVFPETSLWMHFYTGIIVARRDGPIEIDLARLRSQLAASPIREGMRQIHIRGASQIVDLYGLGAEQVEDLVAGASLITDDHPTLEFETARPLAPDELQEWIHRIHTRRLTEPPPLRNATPKETRFLEEHRNVATSVRIARLWSSRGDFERARSAIDAALETTTTDANRAQLLLRLALLARDEGDDDEARRRVEESLRLRPMNDVAQKLRSDLGQ